MKIDKLFRRTDSKIAWYWIVQSQKEWKPFVQRVDEIRKLVPEDEGIIVQGLTTQPTYSLGAWTVMSWRPVCYGGMVPSGLLVLNAWRIERILRRSQSLKRAL